MEGINRYSVGMDGNKPSSFVVSDAKNNCALRLNSNYFVGVDDNSLRFCDKRLKR